MQIKKNKTKANRKQKQKNPTKNKIHPNRWTYPKLGTSPMWTELKSMWGQELKLHSGNANLHSRHLTSVLTCWSWQEWKGLPSTHAQNVSNTLLQVSTSSPPHNYLWHLLNKPDCLPTERITFACPLVSRISIVYSVYISILNILIEPPQEAPPWNIPWEQYS